MSDEDTQHALEAKARGNAALKAGKYDEAISEYSNAIDLDPDNAVYYSNRCAVYLKKGKRADFTKALEDAESAIRNKRDWPKAYSRKGNALCGLGKFDEAIEAFNQALEIAPDNQEYKAAIADVNKARNKRPKTNVLAYAQIALHAITLLCTIIYLVPVVGGPVFFYHALKASILTQIVTVLRHCGMPKFSKAYAQKLVMNQETHYLMPGFVFHLSAPFVVCLAPACLRSVVFLSEIAIYYDIPTAVDQAKKVVAQKFQLRQMGAQMEVGQGLMQIPMLLTPMRNIFVLMFTWQYLRVRYMISNDTKQAFAFFRSKIDLVFYHKYCPGIVGTVWTKVKSFLSSMGDAQQASQSRCSVM